VIDYIYIDISYFTRAFTHILFVIIQILESTAVMDWVWQPEQVETAPVPLSVTAIYQLEQDTGLLLTDLFRPVEEEEVLVNVTDATTATTTEVAVVVEEDEEVTYTDDIINSLLQEQIVLSVDMQVRQQLTRNGRQVLETIVTCQYLSESGIPADLPAVLLQVINKNQRAQLPEDVFWALQEMLTAAIGETEASTLSFSIRSFDESKILEPVFQIDEPEVPLNNDDGRTKADKGLIVAVVMLSVMVMVVSGVLLYITGGWSACHQAVGNCLFEEVDDDYDAPQSKNTFRVSSGSYDDDDNEGDEEEYSDEGDEEESIETGVATNATGILGVQAQDENADPMAGLGIKTPSRNMYGNQNVDMTPMSAMTTNDNDAPLGITSMRKLPLPETPEVRGGLAHMIMERVAKATTYTPKK
jgi:hypothetical protein